MRKFIQTLDASELFLSLRKLDEVGFAVIGRFNIKHVPRVAQHSPVRLKLQVVAETYGKKL